MTKFLNIVFLFTFLILGHRTSAQIEIPEYFSNHMVLQQETEVPFFGKSVAGSKIFIECSWSSNIYSTTTDEGGRWQINIGTPEYGGPYDIKIYGNDLGMLTLSDVLIGDVWFCSGQSNMEMPLAGWGKVNNYKEEILSADYPNIRLFQVAKNQSDFPVEQVPSKSIWQVCSPETVGNFSAAAYFFAREVNKETHIPIGLIQSAWGGTVVEAWTSAQALRDISEFNLQIASLTSTEAKDSLSKIMTEKNLIWKDQLWEANREIGSNWMSINYDDTHWSQMILPGYWDKKEIELQNFDGIILYRKWIELSETDAKNDMFISYHSDDNDKLWVNGHFMGETKGYNSLSTYHIPKEFLSIGKNLVAIQIFDGGNQGGIYGPQEDFYMKTGTEKKNLSGSWKFKKSVDLKNMPSRPYVGTNQNRPTVLFNGMVHPFLQVPLKGVIWYQGESNAGRAHQYRELFPLLIEDWRKQFKQPDLPFYYVQLANFRIPQQKPMASEWAELRDAQLGALQVPHTGMAVAIDLGDTYDIHPKNKQEVGRRLALIALDNLYDKNIVSSGPTFEGYKIDNGNIFVTFGSTGGELKVHGMKLKGFQIAGSDGRFYSAKAELEGKDSVKISSSKVKNPKHVRYNWADNPSGNLYNSVDLPASPFKTDTLKDSTTRNPSQ